MNSWLSFILFAAFFVGMWLYVSYRTSQGGWSALVPKHGTTRPPVGKKMGLVSGQFPGGTYQGCLIVWLADDGLFIRPIIPFRAFHPALLIPWSGVVAVSQKKRFLSKWTAIECEVDDTAFSLRVPGHHETEFGAHVPQTV